MLPPGLKKHFFINLTFRRKDDNDEYDHIMMMTPMLMMMTLMMTMTWLEVSILEEQGLLGRPRQRAKWRPSDDDHHHHHEDVDDDHDDDSGDDCLMDL